MYVFNCNIPVYIGVVPEIENYYFIYNIQTTYITFNKQISKN